MCAIIMRTKCNLNGLAPLTSCRGIRMTRINSSGKVARGPRVHIGLRHLEYEK